MKKLPILLMVAISIALVSCQKETSLLLTPEHPSKPEVSNPLVQNPPPCGNTLDNWLTQKIAILEKNVKQNEQSCSATSMKYALMDFNGHTFWNTPWNQPGISIVCQSVTNQLTAAQRTALVAMVSRNLSPWNVIVGTNESEYNNTPYNERTRAMVTRNMNNIFPIAAGYAVVGSMFSNQTEFPCFIMADNLGYDIFNLSWNITHELSHTMGLNHRSLWQNGQLIYVYYPVTGDSPWAVGDIMGSCYGADYTTLGNGTDEFGNPHYPVAYMNSFIGERADDVPNTTAEAMPVSLNTTKKKVLNNATDVDVYRLGKKTGKVSVIAYNVDIRVEVYSASGQLIAVLDNPNDINVALASITAPTGNKLFFKVRRSPNVTNLPAETAYGAYEITFK